VSTTALTSEVANAAISAFTAPAYSEPARLRTQLAALHRMTTFPLDEDLAVWAETLVEPDGAFPLLGTGAWADTFPALLWCGARLARAGAGADVAALLTGLAAGSRVHSSAEDFDRAVHGAEAASRVLVAHAHPSPMIARPTTAVLTAAAGAALLTGVSADELVHVLDTAASLMVLTPGAEIDAAAALSPLWIGHACAAGWLASALPGLGITDMPSALANTLDVAAGSSPLDTPWHALLDKPLAQVQVRQVMEGLA